MPSTMKPLPAPGRRHRRARSRRRRRRRQEMAHRALERRLGEVGSGAASPRSSGHSAGDVGDARSAARRGAWRCAAPPSAPACSSAATWSASSAPRMRGERGVGPVLDQALEEGRLARQHWVRNGLLPNSEARSRRPAASAARPRMKSASAASASSAASRQRANPTSAAAVGRRGSARGDGRGARAPHPNPLPEGRGRRNHLAAGDGRRNLPLAGRGQGEGQSRATPSDRPHQRVALAAGRQLDDAVGAEVGEREAGAPRRSPAVVDAGAAAADEAARLAEARGEAGAVEQLRSPACPASSSARGDLDHRQIARRCRPRRRRAARSRPRPRRRRAPWQSAVASVASTFFASLISLPSSASSRAISSSGRSVNRRRKRPTSASSVLRQNCQ